MRITPKTRGKKGQDPTKQSGSLDDFDLDKKREAMESLVSFHIDQSKHE